MIGTSAEKKLHTLPLKALYDLAELKNIQEEEIKNKEKGEVIQKLFCTNITEDEIDTAVNDYIYGSRVSFTLWGFSRKLNSEDLLKLLDLDGHEEEYEFENGLRNLHIIAVRDNDDRLELLYNYSKEYIYLSEEGRTESVWELHRGCLWIGKDNNYLASISKHEKMMSFMLQFIGKVLDNSLFQIKPPKKAIERCINSSIMSRVVLQGVAGEKTIISNSYGLTEEQERERDRVKNSRFDTSGSYIADISKDVTATIKYNVTKGSLGVFKHLSSKILFAWSRQAIDIILEEIENLKTKTAEEIYREVGAEIKWGNFSQLTSSLNWFLTEVIAAHNREEESRYTIPEEFRDVLQNDKLFHKLPMIYCEQCESYDIPICVNCGSRLSYNRKGILECSCAAPLRFTCAEQHWSCRESPWYIPTQKLKDLIDNNIKFLFRDRNMEYSMCIMENDLHIVIDAGADYSQVEIPFSDITCFRNDLLPDASIKEKVVYMKEKCKCSCSYINIEKCTSDPKLYCLPKLFYGIIPSFRPQPHKGSEFGDVSGEVEVNGKNYQMIGIIKKNSANKTKKGRKADPDTLIQKPLLSTSPEGEEIIRQFVEQGMTDNRVDVIAIVAPQYFDRGLKGTLNMLAKYINKKIVYIGLDEVCQLVSKNDNIELD